MGFDGQISGRVGRPAPLGRPAPVGRRSACLGHRRPIALGLLLPFLTASLSVPFSVHTPFRVEPLAVGVAFAQEEKPALAVVPFTRRDVGQLAVARVEEYLRQMVDAGGSVRVLSTKAVTTGKPDRAVASAPKVRPVSAASKQLDKADTLALTARTMIEEGEDPEDALKLLQAGAKRYEDNFVELVDFTKLVDVYAQMAAVLLGLKREGEARAAVVKALSIQPTFVVDARKSNKQLQGLVTATRQVLADKVAGELTIECSQPEAEVFVDGVRIGNPPATARDLWQGDHYVQVRKANAAPWGRIIKLGAKAVTERATLVLDDDPANEIAGGVSPQDILDFAQSGSFHDKLFRNTAYLFSKQIRANYLLFGVMARSTRTYDLHLFVFHQKTKKVCALTPIDYKPDLGDLQMKTLDAEGRVRTALGGCDRDLTALPTVYAGGAAEPDPEPVRPRIDPTPPDTDPPDDPKPVKPEPRPVAKPVVFKPQPTPDPTIDPYEGLLEKDEPKAAFYKTWWFWTTVGILAAAGGGTAYFLATREGPAPGGFKATATLP